MVVVACNTATAAAIDYLRSHYDIPFIGMEPAIKPAASLTKSGAVGVLATEGTFKGRLFNETAQKYASNIRVETQVGKGFVELVESGDVNSERTKNVVSSAVLPLVEKGIDYLVLACTHYPFLIPVIEKYTKPCQIQIINPALPVAKQAERVLLENKLLSEEPQNKYEFLSSLNDLTVLKQMVSYIMEDTSFWAVPEFRSLSLL